jgi:hypothetical protein
MNVLPRIFSSSPALHDVVSARKRKHSTFLLDEEMHRCWGRAVQGDTPHLSEVFAFESGLDDDEVDMAGLERLNWNWGLDIPRSVGLWGGG